jgi:hypothetical protein
MIVLNGGPRLLAAPKPPEKGHRGVQDPLLKSTHIYEVVVGDFVGKINDPYIISLIILIYSAKMAEGDGFELSVPPESHFSGESNFRPRRSLGWCSLTGLRHCCDMTEGFELSVLGEGNYAH